MKRLNLGGYLSSFNAGDATVGFVEVPANIAAIMRTVDVEGIFTTSFEFIPATDERFPAAQQTMMDALKTHPWNVLKTTEVNGRISAVIPINTQINAAIQFNTAQGIQAG